MKPVTVSQVNEYIAKRLRDDFNLHGLAVKGEVSGVSTSRGHIYFTLKDAESMIRCAIWKSNVFNIDRSLIKDGKSITVIADISPYSKGGSYSLSVRMAEDAGEGDFMREFNRIKKKLDEEGLFDTKYKKPIPVFPARIGVITSDKGAAVEDIKKIITSKNDYTDIVIFPTVVQGEKSVESICANIILANKLNNSGVIHIDTLIVGRGGGSPEDLASFSDEKVARTVFSSEIPIISAVGHESDFSISDFTADARAETPTAAADMACPDTDVIRDEIDDKMDILLSSLKSKFDTEKILLESTEALLVQNIRNKITKASSSVEKAEILLKENSPLNILDKGYSAMLDENGKLVCDVEKISIGGEYRLLLSNGEAIVKVTAKERKS